MKLSVLMITYNHEAYLAEAIDSVLMQEVDFDYEIVIGEDCSTDSTRSICIDYQKKFPDKIRLLLPERNIGAVANLAKTLDACTGEYIAILEGDDYWVSPTKLQKQVDFLDSHPECAECFGYVTVLYTDSDQTSGPYPDPKPPKITTQMDLLSINYIPTATSVFRNGLIKEFPDWFYTLKMADWPLHILNATHGKIGFIDEVLAVYRVHSGGIWSGAIHAISNLESVSEAYRYYRNEMGITFGRRQRGAELYWRALLHVNKGEVGEAKSVALRSLILCPVNRQFSEQPYRLLLRLYFQRLGRLLSRLRKIIFRRRTA